MKYYFFYLIIFFAVSCKKYSVDSDPGPSPGPISTLNGFAQKGPFIIGSSITLYELDSLLNPTGRVFNTQTTDDNGTFQFDIHNLNSRFVTLEANGYYFNEDADGIFGPLTLYTLSDILDSSTNININVLTDLSRQRTIYLMQHGTTYADAKIQTRREILNFFGFTKPEIKPFENLDITQPGDDNALLLAISLILQGTNYSAGFGYYEGRLTERLAIISNDLEKDGVFNRNSFNDSLYGWLRSGCYFINDSAVKANLTAKYAQMGQSVADLNISKYIDSFLVSTSLRFDGTAFYYPKFAGTWYNILPLTDSVFSTGTDSTYTIVNLQLIAYVPLNSSLSLKIESVDSLANPGALIGYIIDENGNHLDWSYNHLKFLNLIQQRTRYNIQFTKGYSYAIKYYENGATSPTRQKIIKVLN